LSENVIIKGREPFAYLQMALFLFHASTLSEYPQLESKNLFSRRRKIFPQLEKKFSLVKEKFLSRKRGKKFFFAFYQISSTDTHEKRWP